MISRSFLTLPISVVCILLLYSCRSNGSSPQLASLNIIDRDGFSETITASERLKEYEETDFLATQPYQKVLQVYQRDILGNVKACVTSYHPNGQIKQCLDVVNGRAMGCYREWYADGTLKVEAQVIGGDADLHTAAEESWLFEGVCRSWDEEGRLLAEIPYGKGELQGISLYYHPNGIVWKRIPFYRGAIHGTYELYYSDGSLLQKIEFFAGKKQGKAVRYWCYPDLVAAEEEYSDELLLQGIYWNCHGQEIGKVCSGVGTRPLFSQNGIAELHEYRNKIAEGRVQRFDDRGRLLGIYAIYGGIKQGEEIEYYPVDDIGGRMQPHLALNWYEGKLQGLVKTWYPDGIQESQREMSNNAKNGLAMAWYRDGSLMLLEEYHQDNLVKGEYYARGKQQPISQVRESFGLATLFDAEGNFLRKVTYRSGIPTD